MRSESRLIEVGSRVFDLRVEVRLYPDERDFLPDDAPWLRQFLHSDPLMWAKVFIIQRAGETFADRTRLSVERLHFVPLLPDSMHRVPGYAAWGNVRSGRSKDLFLKSLDDPIGHFVFCGDSDAEGTFVLCTVTAAYPPDPTILLHARIFRPIRGFGAGRVPPWEETWKSFRPVADRMRDIAYCLDVTDQLSAGITPNDPAPSDPSKFLEECRAKMTD